MMHYGGMGGCSSAEGSCSCKTRKFLTRKEEIEKLHKYVEDLKKEIIGVEEHIAHLEKKANC